MFEKLWEAYLKEKKYLGGLSQQALDSYVDVYKRWVKHIGKEMPDALNIKEWVIELLCL